MLPEDETIKFHDFQHIDFSAPSVSADEVIRYVGELSQRIKDPGNSEIASATLGTTYLRSTSNPNFCKYLSAQQGERPNIEELSGIKRGLCKAALLFEKTTRQILNNLDELYATCGDLVSGLKNSKEALSSYLSEKLFIYDMFIRAIAAYPEERIDDLKRIYARDKDLIHKNYVEFAAETAEERSVLGEEFLQRKKYFDALARPRLQDLRHFSKTDELDSLSSASVLISSVKRNLKRATGIQNFGEIIKRTISSGDERAAFDALALAGRDCLRATDMVNDVFLSNRFIYFVINGQFAHSTVAHLPFSYSANSNDIVNDSSNSTIINYSSPSHPQAIRAMKLHYGIESMPKVLMESIRLFSSGLYLPEDYYNIYSDILALVCDEGEVDQEMFNFIFNNVVVNPDGRISQKVGGKYSCPFWLKLDESKQGETQFKRASDIVGRINKFCAEHGVIPPLKPYFVVSRTAEVKPV